MPSSSADAGAGLFVPARRRGSEFLDTPRSVPPAIVLRELADVARSNALFGGARAVVAEVVDALRDSHGPATLLDVGTGLGDIPHRAREAVARRGVVLDTIGVELSEAAARASLPSTHASVCADAFQLPFADRSVDIVTCSQVLHHFEAPATSALLRELTRVARQRVIVGEIRRDWLAAAGVWLASWPLGFHAHSRHDGVTSVLRGFTARELSALVRQSVDRPARVMNRAGFRVTASWAPMPAIA